MRGNIFPEDNSNNSYMYSRYLNPAKDLQFSTYSINGMKNEDLACLQKIANSLGKNITFTSYQNCTKYSDCSYKYGKS